MWEYIESPYLIKRPVPWHSPIMWKYILTYHFKHRISRETEVVPCLFDFPVQTHLFKQAPWDFSVILLRGVKKMFSPWKPWARWWQLPPARSQSGKVGKGRGGGDVPCSWALGQLAVKRTCSQVSPRSILLQLCPPGLSQLPSWYLHCHTEVPFPARAHCIPLPCPASQLSPLLVPLYPPSQINPMATLFLCPAASPFLAQPCCIPFPDLALLRPPSCRGLTPLAFPTLLKPVSPGHLQGGIRYTGKSLKQPVPKCSSSSPCLQHTGASRQKLFWRAAIPVFSVMPSTARPNIFRERRSGLESHPTAPLAVLHDPVTDLENWLHPSVKELSEPMHSASPRQNKRYHLSPLSLPGPAWTRKVTDLASPSHAASQGNTWWRMAASAGIAFIFAKMTVWNRRSKSKAICQLEVSNRTWTSCRNQWKRRSIKTTGYSNC